MCSQVGAEGSDSAAVLSIGAIFMGETPWREPVLELMNHVAAIVDGVQAPLNVNVVFHVPGSLGTPEHQGARTGSFRRRDSHLMLQIALPAEPPPDPAEYLVGSIVDGLTEVERWNARKDRRFDMSLVRSAVESLAGWSVQPARRADSAPER